jgi:hypothetical protein
MKRKLIVDFDDQRENQIMIGPVSEYPNHEIKVEPIFDMGLLCEAVCTMIHLCNKQGIKKDSESLKDCIDHLKKGFIDETYKTDMKDLE